MPRVSNQPPSYRRRVIRGREVAYVTLRDSETGKRRDYWLGPYGTEESRAAYARLLAAWEQRGRRLPPRGGSGKQPHGATITQLCEAYWRHVRGQYAEKERRAIKLAIRTLREYAADRPALDFGPVALQELRSQLLARGLAVRTVKGRVGIIRRILRWAVANELLPVEAYQRLTTLEPLRGLPRRKIGPAPIEHVRAVLPHVSRQVRAMIELQLLTGMRSGEVTAMRPCDIDMSGRVWLYRPQQHKTQHHGRERIVYLGPKAQAVLRPFLAGRATAVYLFSPAEAEQERRTRMHAARKTPLSCGNRPGTNVKDDPKRKPGDRYTSASYGRAIARACKRAGVPKWHPHQLRHNYATEVRRQYGLEAAQILLGHSSALITEAVYAERDQRRAIEIIERIG